MRVGCNTRTSALQAKIPPIICLILKRESTDSYETDFYTGSIKDDYSNGFVYTKTFYRHAFSHLGVS